MDYARRTNVLGKASKKRKRERVRERESCMQTVKILREALISEETTKSSSNHLSVCTTSSFLLHGEEG